MLDRLHDIDCVLYISAPITTYKSETPDSAPSMNAALIELLLASGNHVHT